MLRIAASCLGYPKETLTPQKSTDSHVQEVGNMYGALLAEFSTAIASNGQVRLGSLIDKGAVLARDRISNRQRRPVIGGWFEDGWPCLSPDLKSVDTSKDQTCWRWFYGRRTAVERLQLFIRVAVTALTHHYWISAAEEAVEKAEDTAPQDKSSTGPYISGHPSDTSGSLAKRTVRNG